MHAKRNYWILIVIISIALLFNISIALGEKITSLPSAADPPILEATFGATKDTFVTGAYSNSNTNFGNASSLTIGTLGTSPFIYGYHTLVDFDLSSLPPDSEIVTATLRLAFYFTQAHAPTNPNAQITVYSQAITESWGEYTATWNNRPASSSQGDPANSVDGISPWEEWDVTNIVSAWRTGSLSQNGIILFSTTDSEIARFPFYSREGGVAPQLVVSYRTVTSTDTPTPTTTHTPTPTLPATGSCPGYVTIYADNDTYTDSGDPSTVNGNTNGVALSKSPDTRYMYLHFPVEQVIPANQYIYSAALYLSERNEPSGEVPAPWDVFVFTPLTGFDEQTTTWNNQPGPFLGDMKKLTYASSVGVKVIKELAFFANLWHQGIYPNDGLGISLQAENTLLRYYSREAASQTNRPYLRIQCGSNPPTHTPTPTNTPTPTPTPTAIPKTVNYMAKDLEVTQGVQRITNSVRLVEGKRTFVRFYVGVFDTAHFEGKVYSIDAELRVYRGSTLVETLLPANTPSGYLDLPYGFENPFIDPEFYYMVSDNTFIFEIPSHLTNGSLRLVGDVNIDWKYPETNWIDNEEEVTVDFETVPQFGVRIYRIKWQDTDNTYYTTSMGDIANSLNFARQGLPIPNIWAQSYMYQYYMDYGKAVPKESILNQYLSEKWLWDFYNNGTLFQDFPIVRYYALIDKNDSVSGGLANAIPGAYASGWTGRTSTFSHELAHTFGRHHATYCEAENGCSSWNIFGWQPCPDGYEDYPYNQGRIGPYSFSVQGFVYDNNNNFEIRSTEWKDVMTYCGKRWLSDFTYHRIMDYLQPGLNASQNTTGDRSTTEQSDFLLVSGNLDPDTGLMEVRPFFVFPASNPLKDYTSGEFAIVLRDISGSELARYWFTPPVPITEKACSLEETTSAEEENSINILELVPYHPLTARVDIEGPADSGVLTSVTSGPSLPSVKITSPNGGEIFAGDAITVTWNAADADDNTLFFNVQYSPDNGSSWDLVASNIQGTQAIIPRDNFQSSPQALIRVYASDGIHTSSDTSNAVFTIANAAPNVEITQPITDAYALLGQTVAFSAFAYDLDLGVIGGEQLTWSSDIDGILGHGSQFSTAALSTGTHTITVFVNDSAGGVVADSVQVTIYADASQLPPLPNKMKVGPGDIIIDSFDPPGTPFIQIYNANNANPIPWSASSSESWLDLSSTSGTTTDQLLVSVDYHDLAEGPYTGTVTITNQDNPAETFEVSVYLTVQRNELYLPLISRSP